jgi:hypothetical protein
MRAFKQNYLSQTGVDTMRGFFAHNTGNNRGSVGPPSQETTERLIARSREAIQGLNNFQIPESTPTPKKLRTDHGVDYNTVKARNEEVKRLKLELKNTPPRTHRSEYLHSQLNELNNAIRVDRAILEGRVGTRK